MKAALKSITDQAIKDAAAIYLVDPNSPKYCEQIHGMETPGLTSRFEARTSPSQLDIEIDSTDKSQILAALNRIESVRGHLPDGVMDRLM